tara:strand:+ start:145 stop:396 length:252 start_codon:yes stop_codon:yes gene_type:complete
MNEKLLLEDINFMSLSELTDLAYKIIDQLEHEEDLEKSTDIYQKLLKVNILIEKKFQKNYKEINQKTKLRIKEIKKNNEKKIK